jgi:hypothetical protein
MCKGCGKAKKNGKCIICKKIKKEVIGGLKWTKKINWL